MTRPLNAKVTHRQTILRALLRMPQSTKPELCQVTGLPPSTVHNVVEELTGDGLIHEAGIAASNGGRRAVRYGFNAGLGVIAAACIRLDHLETGVYDLCGKCLYSASIPLVCSAMGPESYTAELAAAVEQALATVPGVRCFGLGVTVPGPVDVSSGVVMQLSSASTWQHFPLGDRLHQALGIAVAVDKDTYAGICHLERTGRLRQKGCAVYLSICEGIGAAMMADGHVFRGTHSLAGEIGHLTVRRDGIPCTCGNTGCLELYCSDTGIVKQYNAQSGNHCRGVDEIIALMSKGDELAAKVFSQAMRYLVDTTSTIIMSYDPDELIIYCRWLNQQRSLYFRMLDALYVKSIFTQKHAVDIRLLDDKPLNLNAAFTLARDALVIERGGVLD